MLGRIPASRLYAPGIAILNAYPLPNASGAGYNYESQVAVADRPARRDLPRRLAGVVGVARSTAATSTTGPTIPIRAGRRGVGGGGGGAGARSRGRARSPSRRRAERRAVPQSGPGQRALRRVLAERGLQPAIHADVPGAWRRPPNPVAIGHALNAQQQGIRRRRRNPRRRRHPHNRRPGPQSGAGRTRAWRPQQGSAPDGGDQSDRRRLRRRGGDRRARLRHPHALPPDGSGVPSRGHGAARPRTPESSRCRSRPKGIDVKAIYTAAVSRGWSISTTRPGCRRSCAARTRRCISASRGQSGNTPAFISTTTPSGTRITREPGRRHGPASVRWPSTNIATHRGYDSDHPRVAGDVGMAGVADGFRSRT